MPGNTLCLLWEKEEYSPWKLAFTKLYCKAEFKDSTVLMGVSIKVAFAAHKEQQATPVRGRVVLSGAISGAVRLHRSKASAASVSLQLLCSAWTPLLLD